MSDIRPRRLGVRWSLHTDAAGSSGAVDTFQVLTAPTITGVTNGGTFLNIAITDPNAGADTFQYTYHVQRSVDGSPLTTIYHQVTGGIVANLQDNVMFVIGPTVTLADGSQVTFPASVPILVTMHTTPGFNPVNAPTLAAILFDTTVIRDGHTLVLPTGTVVTLPTGTNWTTVATPKGHTYAYKVSIQNKFQTTAFSNTDSVAVASAWTAQTQNVPTRLDNEVTLTWVDPNVYATGDKIEIWKDVDGAGYSLLVTLTKEAAVAMPTSYVEAFDFLTLIPATYSYKLRAVSGGISPQDTGAFSNIQSLIVNFTLLQITPITATPMFGDTQIDLAWTDPNAPIDEAGIYIDRAVGTGGQFQRIATVAPGVVAYSDVFPTEPGQTYQYRVTPFNSLHPGPVSPTASATTAVLTPTITSLEQLADVGVRVFWSDENRHATGYDIERSLNGGAFVNVGSVGGADRQFDDFVALSIGNVVAYKVRAFNASVTGTFSAPVEMIIHRTLVAPTNVTPVFVRFGIVTVAWTGLNSGNRGVSLFKSVNGSAFTLLATLPKDARSYSDMFQTIPGQVYAYQVQDFNNQETGPLSAIGVTSSPLDAPVSLEIAAVVPPDHVTLQWTFAFLPTSTNEDYVSVERSFAGGAFSEIGRVPYGGSPTFFAQTSGGVPGDIVSFRIRKIKLPYTLFGTVIVPANIGDYSAVVSTVAALSVPTAVTISRTVAGVNHVNWTDTNTLATGFKIFRQVTHGGVVSPLIQVATVNGGLLRDYDDVVDASPNDVFTYAVMAFNAQTSSIYSGYGTLTTRFPVPRIELSQPLRTRVTIDRAVQAFTQLPGDQLQLFRSKNGAPATVINVSGPPFFLGFLYNDDDVVVGDTVSYSARLFSTTELGPMSTVHTLTVGDIINTPLGNIKQTRIHGARNKFVQREVFAVGASGIAKISFDVNDDPVVTSSANPAFANAMSGISGDQTRFVVFVGPGLSQAVLVDATNLAVLDTEPLSFADIYTYSGGAFTFGSAQLDFYPDVESANYTDGASGDYSGWGLVNFTPILNMNPNFPLRLVPWSSNLTSIGLSSFYVNGSTSGQTTVATPFSLASILPKRLENLNGDCAFCVNPTGNFTTIYRAARSGNNYAKLVDIPGRVMDIVSDGVAKLLAVTLKGEIYLIDMQFNPTNPSFNIIGRVPEAPINGNGDIINPATGFISMELMASKKIAVAVGTQTTQQKFSGGFQSRSSIYIFNVPGVLTTNGALSLATTISSIEKIKGLAFDGRKYIYATSNDTAYRLIRFNAGF